MAKGEVQRAKLHEPKYTATRKWSKRGRRRVAKFATNGRLSGKTLTQGKRGLKSREWYSRSPRRDVCVAWACRAENNGRLSCLWMTVAYSPRLYCTWIQWRDECIASNWMGRWSLQREVGPTPAISVTCRRAKARKEDHNTCTNKTEVSINRKITIYKQITRSSWTRGTRISNCVWAGSKWKCI